MKLWLSICAALVFAAGCAVGLLLNPERYCGSTVPAPAEQAVAEKATGDGAIGGVSVVASMVDPYPDYPLYLVSREDIYDEIGLDEGQRRKLEALFASHYEQVREVREGMAKVATTLRVGILELLSPEQEKRFNEVQKRYSENKTRVYVEREMVSLREELDLRYEQEPAVYKHLYDAALARREVYGKKPCKDNCKRIEEINKKLESRLKRELFQDQYAAYVRYQEQRKPWVKKKKERKREEAHPQGKSADEDCSSEVDP